MCKKNNDYVDIIFNINVYVTNQVGYSFRLKSLNKSRAWSFFLNITFFLIFSEVVRFRLTKLAFRKINVHLIPCDIPVYLIFIKFSNKGMEIYPPTIFFHNILYLTQIKYVKLILICSRLSTIALMRIFSRTLLHI